MVFAFRLPFAFVFPFLTTSVQVLFPSGSVGISSLGFSDPPSAASAYRLLRALEVPLVCYLVHLRQPSHQLLLVITICFWLRRCFRHIVLRLPFCGRLRSMAFCQVWVIVIFRIRPIRRLSGTICRERLFTFLCGGNLLCILWFCVKNAFLKCSALASAASIRA